MKHTFTTADEGKQFICITVTDESKTGDILRELENRYPAISETLFDTTADEILIELLDNISFDFSLQRLKKEVNEITPVEVTYLCVDFEEAKDGRDIQILA